MGAWHTVLHARLCMPGGHWAARHSSLSMRNQIPRMSGGGKLQCRLFPWMMKFNPVAGWRNHVQSFASQMCNFNKERCVFNLDSLVKILKYSHVNVVNSKCSILWLVLSFIGATFCHLGCFWLARQRPDQYSAQYKCNSTLASANIRKIKVGGNNLGQYNFLFYFSHIW